VTSICGSSAVDNVADFALSDLTSAAPAEERGTLDVHARALEHIAERAAEQVPDTVRQSSALDRIRRKGYPHASVTVQRSRAWIELDVAATWPCRVTELATQVRDRVLAEAARLSGIDVRSVDVNLHIVERSSGASSPDRSLG
jgi:uncharacterized alkaline shock family protein YloU